MNKQFFVNKGKEGAKKRWDKVKATRMELIDKVRGQVDKEVLDLIQAHLSNEDIEKLLKSWGKKKSSVKSL